MKKRKATLCLALAAVFGISSVAGCSKTPNNSGQDEKAAESQAGSAVGGADGSGDGSGSSGESTAIKEAGQILMRPYLQERNGLIRGERLR